MPEAHVKAGQGDFRRIIELAKPEHPQFAHLSTREPLLGKAPLHLAASGGNVGHFAVVSALLKAGVDPNIPDGNGYTALHGLLLALEDAETEPSQSSVQIVQALFQKPNVDLNFPDHYGRTALTLARASMWPAVKDEVSNPARLVGLIRRCKPFDAGDFMAAWRLPKTRGGLERGFWDALKQMLGDTSPGAEAKQRFVREHLLVLDVWREDRTLFARLQQIAEDQNAAFLDRACERRDQLLAASEAGNQIRDLPSFGDKVCQTFLISSDVTAALGAALDFDRPRLQDQLEDDVLVPLLRLQAEQAAAYFEATLRRVFPRAIVATASSPDVAVLTAEPPSSSQVLVKIADVKGIGRMKEKVGADRAAAASSTSGDWRPSFAEKLGDCLRCTIECSTANAMWDAYKQIQHEFDLTPQNGRLKNRMNETKMPPNMLINARLKASAEHNVTFPMEVEIQIHDREINKVKERMHLLYEISRASDIESLVGAPTPRRARAAIVAVAPPSGGASAGGAGEGGDSGPIQREFEREITALKAQLAKQAQEIKKLKAPASTRRPTAAASAAPGSRGLTVGPKMQAAPRGSGAGARNSGGGGGGGGGSGEVAAASPVTLTQMTLKSKRGVLGVRARSNTIETTASRCPNCSARLTVCICGQRGGVPRARAASTAAATVQPTCTYKKGGFRGGICKNLQSDTPGPYCNFHTCPRGCGGSKRSKEAVCKACKKGGGADVDC
jgi:hypothetical protein